MHNLIVTNLHEHYRLHFPGERPIDAALKPIRFRDPHFALSFVRGLGVEIYRWRHILADLRRQVVTIRSGLRDHEVYETLAHLIVRGQIKVYLVAHLAQRSHFVSYPVIAASKELQYRFIPASMLLVKQINSNDLRIFRDAGAAEKFVQPLNLSDAQIETIVNVHA